MLRNTGYGGKVRWGSDLGFYLEEPISSGYPAHLSRINLEEPISSGSASTTGLTWMEEPGQGG